MQEPKLKSTIETYLGHNSFFNKVHPHLCQSEHLSINTLRGLRAVFSIKPD